MRIVIDLQGAQTESRFRGIGRYSMSFTRAIARNRNEHDVFIVLNAMFPETVDPIRAAFDDLLPRENIRLWYAPGPVQEGRPGNDWRREVAEHIREAFIAGLRPDVVHITSLFEGYLDDAATSVGRFDSSSLVSVTLHDLIPLLNPDYYLHPNPVYREYYQRKIEHLRRADLLLAISESSRQEGIACLDHPPDAVITVPNAADEDFRPLMIDEDQALKLRAKFGLDRPFLLYAGGADERKNLPRLIRAYAGLSPALRGAHQLVLAGKMPVECVRSLQNEAKTAGLLKDELVFTHYVTDEELVKLYNLCRLFVFPSWHEGFGLPALEAMSCGAVVIGSDIPSHREVIGREKALFDPHDEASISRKMAEVLEDDTIHSELAEHGLKQAAKFSWDESARQAIAAFERLHEVKHGSSSGFHSREEMLSRLVQVAANAVPPDISQREIVKIAHAMDRLPRIPAPRQLLVDISELVQRDAGTGIQRVTKSILKQLLANPVQGYVVEPVYATRDSWGYHYARHFASRFLGRAGETADDPVDHRPGDIFLGLDLQHHIVAAQKNYLTMLRRDGVRVVFVVHDLLPITLPDCFPNGTASEHKKWLLTLAEFQGVVCVSQTVADELREWLSKNGPGDLRSFKIAWSHNGADIEDSLPTRGMPQDAAHVLDRLSRCPSFLTVGTLEPRKCHAQMLKAFELLWNRGIAVNLVIVGKEGWMVADLMKRLRNHPQRNQELFLLEGISDEYLGKIYEASTCLIAASRGEGFGLPLIEAAQHRLPIMARDIPVFREVAGEYATYFQGLAPEHLAEAVMHWMKLDSQGLAPQSAGMPRLTWAESARQLLNAILEQGR
jgi:glycosyltransferase involved in cell wall biosynthesis